MRVLLMTTVAASALAIGVTMKPAQSLPPGGKIAGPDAAVQKVQQKEKGMMPGTEGQRQGGPSKGGPGMGGPGAGGKMQGPGGAQFRPGERTERGTQLRGERGTRGGAELRLREQRGGRYGYGPRTRERGVYIERERRGPRYRGGVYVGPGYGYVSGCAWLRRRALETDSAYWWRRYRACRGW